MGTDTTILTEAHDARPAKGSRTGPPARSEGSPDSRFGDWRSSWRIALRMARRDLRLHKGRAALVALMVGIPILTLSWIATFGSGLLVTSSEDPSRVMGTASALVSGPESRQLFQTGSGWNYATRTEEDPDRPGELRELDPTPIPGHDPEGTARQNAGAIGALVGGTATPIANTTVRVPLGDRKVLMHTLTLDGSSVDFGDKVELLTGRWPVGPDEALVSEPGIRKGLPASGTFDIVTEQGTRTITVVGTGTGVLGWGLVPHLISAEPLVDMDDSWFTPQWLITGTDMPFEKVHELGRYGLQVLSAELMLDPVPRDQLPPDVQQVIDSTPSVGPAVVVILAAVVLALVIGLMVAPAFAVSASRQRHTLALAASNGATTRQLRRTVLAQALLLGVLAAVIGALLGVAGAAVLAWRRAATATDLYLPLLDVPWPAIAGFVAIASIASVAAALLPARRLGRLDIMGVIKGQSVSPAPSRVLPVIGLILMVAGGAAVLFSGQGYGQRELVVAGGAVLLVVGALLLVPMTLVLAGRLSARLPVSLRMATRDATRQRTRSVPTVAAVMGGVAALTMGLIGGASDNKENLATYQPSTVIGQGRLYVYDELDIEPAQALIREIVPQAEIVPMVPVARPLGPVDGEQPFTVVTAPGCSAEQSIADEEWWTSRQAAFEASTDKDSFEFGEPPCPVVGGPTSTDGDLVALPAAEIIRRLGLSGTAAEQVREGAVVALESTRLSGGTVTAWSGTYVFEESTGQSRDIVVTQERPLPLLTVSNEARRTGALPIGVAALVPLELAVDSAWSLDSEGDLMYLVTAAPNSQISAEDEELIVERLDSAGFFVERGFVDEMTKFFTILVAAAAFILLVIILTSTALSMAEQRRDDSTLAAVGATRGTRRAMAAAQGFTGAAIGAVLGLAVGIVPGIAFARSLTTSFSIDGSNETIGPFIEIPYGFLAVVVVGVPLLAALISALAVRRAPTVTRRAD